MNELIRKFEKESHIDVYSLGTDRAKWEYTLEKFSQLIVQECIDYCGENLSRTVAGALLIHLGIGLQEEKAIQFVMEFYNVTREEAIVLYQDEIEAYMRLVKKGVV